MRTVNFRDEVMYVVARKMGIDPTMDFPPDLAESYVDFINLAVKKLYPLYDWPEWTFIEQRTPAAHYIDWAQAGQSAIGRVLKVYCRDPQTTDGIVDIPFSLSSAGIFCGFEHGTNVWLKYIKPAPQYSATVWASGTTYPLNGLTYEPTGGNSYISIQAANTNHAPATNPTWWTLVDFPEQIVVQAIRLAYAEALREDGQNEKADAEEKMAFDEAQAGANILVHPSYDPITDQSRTAPRYRAVGATP